MAKLNRLENGNIELTLTLPWSDIQTQFAKEVDKAINETELPGFRKGKAPKEMVEPRLDKTKLYSRAVEAILPHFYSEGLKEHDLKPIVYPKIKLVSGELDKDWEFLVTTCELPQVELPDYKKDLPKNIELPQIIEWLRNNSKVTTPEILVEEEANHRLASLAENFTRLGLSTDAYLKSKNQTDDQLKEQTRTGAKADLDAEFVLSKIQLDLGHSDRKQTLDALLEMVK